MSINTIDLKSEILELLRAYQKDRSLETRNKLVELNIGLVRKEAHHWVNQCTQGYDDLVQVGSIGLIRAIERFDISKGNAFSSFAIPYIKGEIQHYLRDKGTSVRIPRQWQELHRQSIQVTRQLREKLNRQPSDSEIAIALQISREDWQQIKLAHQNRSPISLDTPAKDGSDEASSSLGEMLPDTGYRSFQLAQEDVIRLQQALSHLEVKTRQIVEYVFLHDLTQKEVADTLNISVVTVSRRVKKGLESLKTFMGSGDD